MKVKWSSTDIVRTGNIVFYKKFPTLWRTRVLGASYIENDIADVNFENRSMSVVTR